MQRIIVLVAGMAVLTATGPAFGRIAKNTIGGTAALHANGRVADGVLLVACTPGERVKLRMTLTQGAAIAEGYAAGDCLGEEEAAHYPVKVTIWGVNKLQPGPADACAVAVDLDRGRVVDTRQWCRAAGPVELVGE
jgi:hypothetical protein